MADAAEHGMGLEARSCPRCESVKFETVIVCASALLIPFFHAYRYLINLTAPNNSFDIV